MRLHKRAVATVFTATVALSALAPHAMAVPMPWETSKTPTSATHGAPSPAAGVSGTVTVLCVGGCYQ
ncbi:hypothetical protein ACIP10_33840 [Streptomyces galbus]|uniref:hypothetical protein n=1 Tax=Streptomyces galbus TaxID=33898 RepID=UPI0037B7F412